MILWDHDPSPETLNSEQIYHLDISRAHPRLTDEQLAAVITQAREGDETAKETLIVSCLPYVISQANRHRGLANVDYLDLIGEGNHALVERVDDSLNKDSPRAYLVSCARWAMWNYCRRHGSLITMPETDGAQLPMVESLDEPSANRNGESFPLAEMIAAPPVVLNTAKAPDYTSLYHALETLPATERAVLEQHFGLGEQAPTRLSELDHTLPESRASTYKQRALKRLQACLDITCTPERQAALVFHPQGMRLPPGDSPTIFQRYQQGETHWQLAQAYHCSTSAIWNAIQQAKQSRQATASRQRKKEVPHAKNS